MKLLLVQTSFLGDTVLSTPVIAALKRRFPDAELWMMVTPQAKPLVERDPDLAGVLAFDKRGADAGLGGLLRKARMLRRMSFDRVYSLHKSFRTSILLALSRVPERVGFASAQLAFLYTKRAQRDPALHDVLRNLSILACDSKVDEADAELRLVAPPRESLSPPVRAAVERGHNIVLVPGSAWKTKMWQWQGYREVAQHFLERGRRVVVLGGPDEISVAARVSEGLNVDNLAGKSSIAELLAVIESADLVVCNDSMSLHVASAFKVPTVPVFCATSPRFGFAPWRTPHSIVEVEGLACKPCRRHGSNRCPTGTESCMRDVPSSRVISAAERLLNP